MCLLALFNRVAEDAPVVAGANREEAYARGGEPPRVLEGPVRVLAGIDPSAGGTWFGVNERGLLVAVTNRLKSEEPQRPRSRGLLARDLLSCPNARVAVDRAADELGRNRYAGCNLLCADAEQAVVIHAGDWLRVRPLPAGLHVLTNRDVNDSSDRRLGHAVWWLGQQATSSADECVTALRALCAQSEPLDVAMCLHGPERGTVSSSIVALRRPPGQAIYLHAQGPPDRTPYVDC